MVVTGDSCLQFKFCLFHVSVLISFKSTLMAQRASEIPFKEEIPLDHCVLQFSKTFFFHVAFGLKSCIFHARLTFTTTTAKRFSAMHNETATEFQSWFINLFFSKHSPNQVALPLNQVITESDNEISFSKKVMSSFGVNLTWAFPVIDLSASHLLASSKPPMENSTLDPRNDHRCAETLPSNAARVRLHRSRPFVSSHLLHPSTRVLLEDLWLFLWRPLLSAR